MAITYLPTEAFNALIDTLGAIDPASEDEARDNLITEALVAAGVWPDTWHDLMGDDLKMSLITSIKKDRKLR